MDSIDTRPQERSDEVSIEEAILWIICTFSIIVIIHLSSFDITTAKVELDIGGSDESMQVVEIPEDYFIRPLRGGWRTRGLLKIDFRGKPHKGVDIACEIGTPIVAAANGFVILSNNDLWGGGHGRHIKILHPNGFTTMYGHMSELHVIAGERVIQGQQIGLSGNTGMVYSSHGGNGAHLHYQVQMPDGTYLDLGT